MEKYYIIVNGDFNEFSKLNDALEYIEDIIEEGTALSTVKIIKGYEVDPDITVTDFIYRREC